MSTSNIDRNRSYWIKNLRVVGVLLFVWFIVSFGCSILWVDQLDVYKVGHVKLGFWFAQQGSIYAFTLIIVVYVLWMNRIEDKAFARRKASKKGGRS